MNHSYTKNNSDYDFFGLKSDKKKKTEQESYPYRAKLAYDSAPSLLGRIASSDNTPSLFAPRSEGERIRKTLQSAVDKALGKGKYSGIFDGIDSKKIEENIPVAESVIKKNKEKNAYSMEDTKNLPNLRDGLAAFYALSEAGNHKAANVARKIAYTPDATTEKKRETESKTPDFFGEAFSKPKIAPAVYRGNSDEKNRMQKVSASFTDKIDLDYNIPKDEYFVFGKENQPSVITKDVFPDDYKEYLSQKEILPDGIFNRYVLTGTAQKSDTKSQSSENQIISTSEAATLAEDVYALSKYDGSEPKGTDNWKYEKTYSYSNSEGLQIAVFSRKENGKTYYAVVNAGSEGLKVPKEFISDWTNNLQQPFGASDDMKDSIAYAQKFVAEHPDAEIIFIGHSKGGAEAAANAVATNCNAIIFNPARANFGAYDLKMGEYDKNIQAYVVDEEFIEALLGDLPETYYDVTKLDELSPYEKALRQTIGYTIPGAIYNIADSIYRHKMEKIIDELGKENKK